MGKSFYRRRALNIPHTEIYGCKCYIIIRYYADNNKIHFYKIKYSTQNICFNAENPFILKGLSVTKPVTEMRSA